MDEELVRSTWRRDVGTPPGGEQALEALVARHREPHRRYHGLKHVASVVATVDDLLVSVPVEDPSAVRLAALFHDAVYDPTAAPGHDEEASAALAERVLTDLDVPPARVATVARLVRATAGHTVADEDPTPDATPDARAVLLDADLAVLAERPAVYDAYVTGVRAEYGHVDDETWRAGRGAVLRSFLDRPRLYLTPPMAEREALARANLAAELATLTGSHGT